MKKMILTAAAALSVSAFPVALADARPGHGGGKGHDGRAHGVQQDDRTTRGGSRKCKRTHAVAFVVKGSLASFTAETVTLDVKRANRHARSYLEAAESTFALGTARVRFKGVTDADASGAVDFADVLPTDKVVAIGKATRPKRGCEGETVLKLRKLQVVRPEAEESGDSEGEQA